VKKFVIFRFDYSPPSSRHLDPFNCLRANGVKLNLEKCVFGVSRDMLLGYIVSQRGTDPNPENVAALDRMGPIRDL
jgi:hypothetical protein